MKQAPPALSKLRAAVRTFYPQFSGQVIVGLEASGYSPWSERLLEELGHQVWLGDATEIQGTQSNLSLWTLRIWRPAVTL